MAEPAGGRPPRGFRQAVAVTGLDVASAAGRDRSQLFAAALAGRPLPTPVTRFDVSRRRARVAATLPGSPDLLTELVEAIDRAGTHAGLTAGERAGTGLLLAARTDYTLARLPAGDRPRHSAGALAAELAAKCGLGPAVRAYTCACVAASTAIADAASAIASGRAQRLVVAAGYLVDPDHFALFDSGRALADDGALRPFSAGRRGMVLGDAVAAVVLESAAAVRRRDGAVLAWLAGWGRAGDAYHVCQPHPDGQGLGRAVDAALARAAVGPDRVGYVNAHGSGTQQSDAAETAALHRSLGEYATRVPVSSTKAVHGHALEASGLIELALTVLAVRTGALPVNAGFLGPDPDCHLDLVLGEARAARPRYALSLNSAFGGANTALLVGAA